MALHDINNFLLPKHCIGTVESVAAGKIVVHVVNEAMLAALRTYEIVLLSGRHADEKLIGIVTKLVKKTVEDDDGTRRSRPDAAENYCLVNLIGSFYNPDEASKRAKLKRVVHTYPNINSEVFQVNEAALRMIINAMNKRGNGSLTIGHFADNPDASAAVDGNCFFQNPACIVGDSGSGKSYAVANILEKASELPHSNMIVFDLRGEYKELSYAEQIKIGDGLDSMHRYFMSQETGAAGEEYLKQFAARMLGNAQKRIKVIDLLEVPCDMRAMVIGVITRMLYEIQSWMTSAEGEIRNPLILVCEDAHRYMAHSIQKGNAAERKVQEIFERVAREGSECGIGLLLVSQHAAELNTEILSHCHNIISQRLTNNRDVLAVASMLTDSQVDIVDMLPDLDVGECVVFGDAMMLPVRLVLHEPLEKPKGVMVGFWDRWNNEETAMDVDTALLSWVRQSGK